MAECVSGRDIGGGRKRFEWSEVGTRRKLQYVTEIKTLVDSAHRASVIFGDKAVEAENCSTCPTFSSCHGAGRGEGRADVSTKQKVFPRRQSVGVMTVMPQHAEHSHASSPYDGGSAKESADVNATQLVSSTTQHRGSVVGAPRPPQATPKYDNDDNDTTLAAFGQALSR